MYLVGINSSKISWNLSAAFCIFFSLYHQTWDSSARNKTDFQVLQLEILESHYSCQRVLWCTPPIKPICFIQISILGIGGFSVLDLGIYLLIFCPDFFILTLISFLFLPWFYWNLNFVICIFCNVLFLWNAIFKLAVPFTLLLYPRRWTIMFLIVIQWAETFCSARLQSFFPLYLMEDCRMCTKFDDDTLSRSGLT